ncbi:nicotinate-nucleotide--dimethylbenzimidazole phosphoribosyltransferase [Azospirillum sp. SYSU D00513]|uniref:nicotinate-nucleotide--dimethylbenzimidazole phosphoribosyltransferase n=1 Tax=Azospirillum sp. SYSU D00513 TaxID=2812561 RepID=UPI001A96A1E0|nr:nicotinate-nucleotide--dimethylbenzimidazole phosphoribosyltransferase [Azospirillum sp. SYSU D00513]
MSNPQPAISFEEIRSLLRNLPGPDLDSGTAALQRERQLTKPAGSLGRLEELAQWMSTWQGQHPPDLRRPRIAVFAGNHGVAARGVSAYPAEVTAQMVANFQNGGAAVNQLSEQADADLRVYELDLDNPTADFTQGPAMGEEDCCRAMAYGMMAVEMGVQLIALGEMGIGNSTSAAALCAALFGGDARDWTGRGTGVDDEGLARKVAAVEAGLAANPEAKDDPLEALRRLGGYELAAIAGAIMAARMARVPVLLDGFACTAAAAVLHKADPRALDHCVVGHRSVEPGHSRLLEIIGKESLLDLGMRLGEGSGAALAINIVKAAVACHSGMATFTQAGVSGRKD